MFTKSTSNNKCLQNLLLIKSLTMFLESESYFHKFQFSYCFQSFHVKCRATVTLQSIGGFGLNFLNLTPLIKHPGSASGRPIHRPKTLNRPNYQKTLSNFFIVFFQV